MERQMTRRGFVTGAAGAAALLAAMGAAGAQAAPVDAASVETWDYAADVVVCGLGVAGAMAAREAAVQGLSCVVVEAAPRELAGGASTCFGGYYVPSPVEALTSGMLEEAGAAAVADEAAAEYGWMLTNGLPVGDIMKVEGAGRAFYLTLQAAMDGIGTPVLYETRATSLVCDAGSVVGVEAQAANGSAVRLLARRGVVLACGGVAENPDLMDAFFFPGVEVLNTSSPYNRGDGIAMGVQVAAQLHNMGRFGIELQELALTEASHALGTAAVCWPAGPAAGARVVVNASGQRFMDESLDLAHYKGLCPWLQFPGAPQLGGYQGYVNMPMYLVCDSKLAGSEPLGEGLVDYGWAISTGAYAWSANNEAEVEAGWIAKGDTLEELVANLAIQSGNDAIDAAALQDTLDAYNAAIAAGEPDAFGRTDAQPVDEPPYYAAQLSMSAMYTVGGLTGGANGRTLDWSGAHIEGLWHAGDVGQPTTPGVLGCCPAGATGTLAVRDIAAFEPREVAGEVLTEVEPVGETGVAVATGGLAALA